MVAQPQPTFNLSGGEGAPAFRIDVLFCGDFNGGAFCAARRKAPRVIGVAATKRTPRAIN